MGWSKNGFVYLLILTAVVALLFSMFSPSKNYQEVGISTVAQWVKDGKVEEIVVSDGELKIKRTGSGKILVSHKEEGVSITETLLNLGVPQEKLSQLKITVENKSRWSDWITLLGSFLPLIFVAALFYFLMRQAQGANNQALSFGRSRARLFTNDKPTVTFEDVAGVDEAKEELKEVVEFLKEPQKFTALGARIPKGVLLVGPPGTGKTLLAKAVAGEAGVPFFSISGSEFVEMFVGVGASRVRDLFDQAKRHSPCIVFIDEIDAVGRYRGAGLGGSHDEREQTLNQILVEMDGFDTDTNVIVMAASVTSDTPILIRDTDGQVKLIPIGEFVDRYYRPGEEGVEKPVNGVLALGFKPKETSRNSSRLLFGHSAFVPVRGVFRHRVSEIYEIEFEGGKIRATGNHSVFVRTRRGLETKAVAELKPGDKLVALSNWESIESQAHQAVVKSVRKLPYDGYVYDLCGCENEAFFGGETPVLLHNTNRPDILDPALLRPGRFDRRVVLDRPDVKGRRAILEVHVRGKPLDKDVDLDVIAKETPGFVGADIENLVNEAAILAARRNKKAIGMAEFQEAIERVIAGPERRSRIISDEEKRIIAYHEAGHALVMHHLPHCDPVHKVSIIARGMALGYTMPLPEEDRYLHSRSKFLDELAGLLGGRAAEEIVFNDVTTGAANDLEQATKLARAMVTRYGMSEKLGPMTFGEKQELVFLGKEIGEQREYSEKIAQEIDAEVRNIIHQAYSKAKEILKTHRDKLDRLAEALIARETLEGDELKAYLDGDIPDDGTQGKNKTQRRKSTPAKKQDAEQDAALEAAE